MSKPQLVKERLRIRMLGGGKTIDRWINFAIGDVDQAERAACRGIILPAKDLWDVKKQMRELTAMATNALQEGRAEDFLSDLDRVGRGLPVNQSPTVPTFAEYANEWVELALAADSVTESERESAVSILKLHLVPFFGRERLNAISPRLVDRYKVEKKRQVHQYGTGYSAKAINNQLSVLRRVLVRAEEHELIDRVPLSTRMWAQVERPEDDGNWLVPDEEKALIAWLWQQPDDASGRHLALLVQVVAGLRFGELRALQKADLDVAGGGLHIRRSQARKAVGTPKNKHARFQPLPDDLVQRLRRYLLTTEGQRLFVGDRGGDLSNNVLNRALRAACQSAGVREVSSHGLRRTAGSSYGYLGQSQRAIASMLGHTDLKATERYVRVHEGHRHQLVERRWAGTKVALQEAENAPAKAPSDGPVGDLVGDLM
jgi:integrase